MKVNKMLLLAGNYAPELTGIGKYNAELIDWLTEHEYMCTVITTYPYYPNWKIQSPYEKKAKWFSKNQIYKEGKSAINIYRCPHYIPSIPLGIKRVLSDFTFLVSMTIMITLMLFKKKHDLIVVSAPPFQMGLIGWIYQKIKGGKLIYHIHDLQIDAAYELGLIKSSFVLKLMYSLERFILRKSDVVSAISEGMVKKIKAKYERPVIFFPNWVNTDFFHPVAKRDGLKLKFGFNASDKIVLYSGAIGEKQGLEALLYTAQTLHSFGYIKFVICGSGPYLDRLVKLAQDLSVSNVVFLPLKPLAEFNEFLNMADVHLVLQKHNETELFLPSKLTTICAIGGLAIVTAKENTTLSDIVSSNKLAILIPPENQQALTNAIELAIYQDNQLLRNNARTYAIEQLRIDKIISDYLRLVQAPIPDNITSPSNRVDLIIENREEKHVSN